MDAAADGPGNGCRDLQARWRATRVGGSVSRYFEKGEISLLIPENYADYKDKIWTAVWEGKTNSNLTISPSMLKGTASLNQFPFA